MAAVSATTSTNDRRPQIAELIEQKHLVRTVYYAPADTDLKGVETRLGDYAMRQLAERMDRDDLVGDIISNWHKYGQRRKTLVFSVDVAHSVHVRDEFIKSGVRAEHIDGSTPKTETGCNSCEAGVRRNRASHKLHGADRRLRPAGDRLHRLARPTKQLGLFRQMAGRGLRPAPGKTKLILMDHSGAVYRHGLLEDAIEWTLESPSGPTTRRTKSGTSRQLRASSIAASAVPCEPAAKRVRIVAFCRSAVPMPSSFAEGELARVDRNGKPIAFVRSARAHALACHVDSYRRRAWLQARLGRPQVQGKVRHMAASEPPKPTRQAIARGAELGP